MVIDKIHGLQSTSLSLNERFTMLASVVPERVAMRPKRRPMRPNNRSFLEQNIWNNTKLIQQIAKRLQMQAMRQNIRQRLGQPQRGLRRFGSEGNLNMFRSGSFGNLSQKGAGNRVGWRQSNGNLSRSASFVSLNQGNWRSRQTRGFRRRGAPNNTTRGKFSGVNQGMVSTPFRKQTARRGASGGRGRGRAGMLRNQPPKPVPTKEELDDQLDRYMAGTKSALDKELEVYMQNAMDFE